MRLLDVADIYPMGSGKEVIGVSEEPTLSNASGDITLHEDPKSSPMITFLVIAVVLILFRLFYDYLPIE